MGGGGFTGNSSVEWDVHGDSVKKHDDKPRGAKGRDQSGTDDTPEGPVQYFEIRIKLPQSPIERSAFINTLRDALDKGYDTIAVRLPIEDDKHGGPTPNQIRVDWPSR